MAVPQEPLHGLLRFVAEDSARNSVAEQDKQDDDYARFQLVLLQERKRIVAVANRQITNGEVADGAGLLFDPQSTSEIVRALADILLDAGLRARMERLGLQRSPQFTWNRTAERTMQLYRHVAEARRKSPEAVPIASMRQ